MIEVPQLLQIPVYTTWNTCQLHSLVTSTTDLVQQDLEDKVFALT